MPDDKHFRFDRWSRRKAKHNKDHNCGKSGMVGGNPRFANSERVSKPASARWSRQAARIETQELVAA